MAPRPRGGNMTRTSSTDSSVMSNIRVAGARDPDDSADDHVSTSTPPTSLSAASVDNLQKPYKMEGVEAGTGTTANRRKSGRVKSAASSSYNLKNLSHAQFTAGPTSRNVSGLTGQTLVDGEPEQGEPSVFGNAVEKALDMDWEIPDRPPTRQSPRRLQRKPSVKDKIKKAVKGVGSVLGKRGRDAMEAGKRTLAGSSKAAADPKQERIRRELDLGPKGVLDELDLDAEFVAPPMKKARTSKSTAEITKPAIVPSSSSATTKRMKKWQKEGLYAGQQPDMDRTQKPTKKGKKAEGDDSEEAAPKYRKYLPLPMFSYLDNERDFKIPYDIFAPSLKKGDPKPKDWHQLNRNRLIGDAKDLWEKPAKAQEMSYCQCEPGEPGQPGCDEDCHNRLMLYECTPDNCRLSEEQCGNREFAELGKRTKRGGPFDVGVEVVATKDRGFGVRSCRTFAPGQLIMEYTGEIITEEECQRRMRELYKDKQCYYLMEMAGGLVIDGTRGSMARFINHCCAPNCDVRMLKVDGTLRMGVFAGEGGIATGEELSYDYNFDNFGETKQLCYCGADTCRGYLGPRLNAIEQKKQKLEAEAKKQAEAIEAQRLAKLEERRKKVKQDRGSGWRGWLAVDDPETKARLKAEKAAKEEKEKTSARAQRILQRKRSASDAADPKPAPAKAVPSKRRKTTHLEVTRVTKSTVVEEDVADDDEEIVATPRVSPRKTIRAVSTTSRFSEDLPRPSSRRSTSSATRKRSVAIPEEVEIEEAVREAVRDEGESEGLLRKKKKKTSTSEKRKSLLDVASQTAKSVSNAVKSSLLNKPAAGDKMKQSTLNFAKLSR